MGITQQDLADWTGLSKGFIMRLEQGTVTRPSWEFVTSITKDSTGANKLMEDYEEWKVHHRRSNYDKLIGPWKRLQDHGSWKECRAEVSASRVGFCKLFCIHPGVLENFEKKERYKFTPYLREVFLDTGINEHSIEVAEYAMGNINA